MTTPRARILTADARTVALEHLQLDASDVVAGDPRARVLSLARSHDTEIGIWEITPGVVNDTEADEIFVVLSGRGHVTFEDGTTLDLAAGTVVHLRTGERATWTIEETLRKIYILLPATATNGTSD